MLSRGKAQVAHPISDLKRLEYGEIKLGDIGIGEWRYSAKNENDYCREIVKTWQSEGAKWDP